MNACIDIFWTIQSLSSINGQCFSPLAMQAKQPLQRPKLMSFRKIYSYSQSDFSLCNCSIFCTVRYVFAFRGLPIIASIFISLPSLTEYQPYYRHTSDNPRITTFAIKFSRPYPRGQTQVPIHPSLQRDASDNLRCRSRYRSNPLFYPHPYHNRTSHNTDRRHCPQSRKSTQGSDHPHWVLRIVS